MTEYKSESGKCIDASSIWKLEDMLLDLEGNIGRCVVHGELNGDDAECITNNIVSDVLQCVIRRWAAEYFPESFEGMDPKDSKFPDDDAFADAYESAGYPIED